MYVTYAWFARSVSITKPETVGVPGWQIGTKALCLYSQFPQACKPVHRALTWLTAAMMKWNALHTIRCVEMHCTPSGVSVAMPLFSIKTLHLPLSARVEPVEDDPPLYK